MLDAKTVLEVLETDAPSVKSLLGPQWAEFSGRGRDLAERFQTIAGEDDPKSAAKALESRVNELLCICWDYPPVAELLIKVKKASLPPGPEGGGSKRLPDPVTPDIIEVKGIANRYYSLLTKLTEAADQVDEHTNDH